MDHSNLISLQKIVLVQIATFWVDRIIAIEVVN